MSTYPRYPTKYNSPKYHGPKSAEAYRRWWWRGFWARTAIYTAIGIALFVAFVNLAQG